MQPNLLMNSWTAAHLPRAVHKALLCSAGSGGECAFWESLQGPYTSDRHQAKGHSVFHLTGTTEGKPFARITTGKIGAVLHGLSSIQLKVTSNVYRWRQDDLNGNCQLLDIDFEMQCISQITPWFLMGCRNLANINLGALSRITTIPAAFLQWCTALESLDLRPLTSVREIGVCFLYKCRSLIGIDLTPLSRITTIPSSFLFNCGALTHIDLSPLINVVKVGPTFVGVCCGLTSINLTGLSNITVIPPSFLQGCTMLTDVDLSPLTSVTTVGPNFMSNCPSLTHIDLTPLSQVTIIEASFLEGCSALKQVGLGALTGVTHIGPQFMRNCASLVSVGVVTSMTNLKEVGAGMLDNSPTQPKVLEALTCLGVTLKK